MATLFKEVDRIRTARDNLVRMRPRIEVTPAPPDDLPRRREWVARETLAHIDEMLVYWMGEIERILAAAEEPVPFGRSSSDLIRVMSVDRDRTLPVSELYVRLDASLERVLRRLLEMDERQAARRGVHARRGEMTVRQIADVMLAEHLEEHTRQIAATLEGEMAVRP